jgi:hypothetical protein
MERRHPLSKEGGRLGQSTEWNSHLNFTPTNNISKLDTFLSSIDCIAGFGGINRRRLSKGGDQQSPFATRFQWGVYFHELT